MPASSTYVSRVNQLDAVQLDEEIYKVLKSQANEITRYQPVGKIDTWQPEIDLLLKFLIWNHSLRLGNSSFGQELLDLQYPKIGKRKSILLLILTALPEYLRDRLSEHRFAPRRDGERKFKSVLEAIGNALKLLELSNLLIFLHRGTQPRVVERLLNISSAPIKSQEPRNIGYSYMTRELLWHGLTELFTLGLPMINFHYLKQLAKGILSRQKDIAVRRNSPMTMSLSSKCAYCNETPIIPSHAGCEHIFCYYCLKAHFTAMSIFHCPGCDARLNDRDIKRYCY